MNMLLIPYLVFIFTFICLFFGRSAVKSHGALSPKETARFWNHIQSRFHIYFSVSVSSLKKSLSKRHSVLKLTVAFLFFSNSLVKTHGTWVQKWIGSFSISYSALVSISLLACPPQTARRCSVASIRILCSYYLPSVSFHQIFYKDSRITEYLRRLSFRETPSDEWQSWEPASRGGHYVNKLARNSRAATVTNKLLLNSCIQ